MKKLIIASMALAVCLGAQAQWSTSGDQTEYTLEMLSAIDGSGVTKDGDAYALNDDLTIAETDKLTVSAGEAITIGNGVRLTVMGELACGSADGDRVSVQSQGLSVLIDGDALCKVVATDFVGLGLLSSSTQPIDVEDCTFENVSASANSQAAIAFLGESSGTTITGCTFKNCEIPAIGSAANAYIGMAVSHCTISDCNQENSNKPMINITTPGANGPTSIADCTILGAQRDRVGGISVSNLVGAPVGDVTITDCEVRDCRYGINAMGPMNIEMRGNKLIDNRYEANAMNGGSGISCTAYMGGLNVVASGNEISGNMWGVTLISYGFLYPGYGYSGFASANFGEAGNPLSPGENVFSLNGNDGLIYDPEEPCDLYNNTDQTVYAQNNVWGTADPADAIVDKSDIEALGEVVYATTDGVCDIQSSLQTVRYDRATQTVIVPTAGDIAVYDLNGKLVLMRRNASLASLASLAPGLYLVRTPSTNIKVRL